MRGFRWGRSRSRGGYSYRRSRRKSWTIWLVLGAAALLFFTPFGKKILGRA